MSGLLKNTALSRALRLSWRGIAAILLIIATASIAVRAASKTENEMNLAENAKAACADAENKPHCYEREVPKLMDEGYSMEQAFKVVRDLQTIDPAYHDCHVLAHNISSKETAKDPSKWKDVVARAPYGMCGNGASHGAFQERFRTESMPDASVGDIMNILDGVCDDRDTWHPSLDERSNCVHGVGHLAMYITGGDVKKSADICTQFAKSIPNSDHRQTCYEGIFMQVFQPLEETDRLLVEGITPKYDGRMKFCDQFQGLVRSICVRESWILVPDRIATPEGFSAHCAPLVDTPDDFRYCVEGIGMGVFMVSLDYDVGKMLALCSALDQTIRPICVGAAAHRFVQTDWGNIGKALDLCARSPQDSHDECYRNLTGYSVNTFASKPDEARRLCGGMPEPWRSECAKGTGIEL